MDQLKKIEMKTKELELELFTAKVLPAGVKYEGIIDIDDNTRILVVTINSLFYNWSGYFMIKGKV